MNLHQLHCREIPVALTQSIVCMQYCCPPLAWQSQVGFIHGDPHPGNLLKVTEGPHAGKLALLDFGLVAEIPLADRCLLRCAPGVLSQPLTPSVQ